MDISANLNFFNQILSGTRCKLIAVSKTYPAQTVLVAYNAGQRDFGENKVQEMVGKFEELPKDIVWHQIGHLQSNKVKQIAPFVGLIHSVDSVNLLEVIDKEGNKNNRTISCLLQIHIATEETKFGFSKEEVSTYLMSEDFKKLKNIRILGMMGMATNTSDQQLIRKEFQGLKLFFEQLKTSLTSPAVSLQELSMGMSSDYKIAIEEGSTMIRVGSAIFGQRNYA